MYHPETRRKSGWLASLTVQEHAPPYSCLGGPQQSLLQARHQNEEDSPDMLATIETGATFKDNLQQLPSIEGVERIDFLNAQGAVCASIANQPGQQGSLAVYQYLMQAFGTLDAKAAAHGLLVFGEHADAVANPGAHPNIDRLMAISAGGAALEIKLISAEG
jgi:hypothetical protein